MSSDSKPTAAYGTNTFPPKRPLLIRQGTKKLDLFPKLFPSHLRCLLAHLGPHFPMNGLVEVPQHATHPLQPERPVLRRHVEANGRQFAQKPFAEVLVPKKQIATSASAQVLAKVGEVRGEELSSHLFQKLRRWNGH